MNSGQIQVHLDGDGRTRRAGTAFFTRGRNALSTTFTYDPEYLAVERAPAIDPHLPLTGGAQHTPALPGAFGDGAPDQWGRNLIDRRERAAARIEGRRSRRLDDFDYLLGVSDHTRQGALRYRIGDGPFLAESVRAWRMLRAHSETIGLTCSTASRSRSPSTTPTTTSGTWGYSTAGAVGASRRCST